MKSEPVRCSFCKTEIQAEACQFATTRIVIDGKEYVFCCAKCAQRYQEKKKS